MARTGPSRPDPRLLLILAVEVAEAAGRLLLERPESLTTSTKSSPTDVVTEMDTAAQQLIRTRLLGARPQDGFLGEEEAETPGSSGVRWVVDPLDGTINYLYDIPAWSVSIAAELDGEVVVGVVHDPVRAETFTAAQGQGAWLGSRRLAVTQCEALAEAMIGTGFSYLAKERARQAEIVAALLPAVRDIRRIGSAALDLCSVAAGRFDGYYERMLNPWDLAAGALIAQEAGATVAGLEGAQAGRELVIAAGPGLFPLLEAALLPWRPDLGPPAGATSAPG